MINIFKTIEQVLASNEKGGAGLNRSVSFYPSAAMSIDLENPSKRIGACVRAEYYRCKRIPKTNPISDYSNYILSYGKILEEWMIDKLKIAGVYVGSNEKFVFPGKSIISGEVDIIIRDDDEKLAVIENKTQIKGQFRSNSIHKKLI